MCQVSLGNYANLLGAVKQADIIISALPASQCLEQKILICAIKEARCIQASHPHKKFMFFLDQYFTNMDEYFVYFSLKF